MVYRKVSSTILILGLALCGAQSAEANTPLTKAVVSSLRNQVRLLPERQSPRQAKLSDVLAPGDGIATSRRSLAELRFNDGSLARMGEQAIFRFIPKTRSFNLSNGTVLMLIPPGRGSTQVKTPNVTAGIRGSALIVRYDQATDSTTVIALTNSQISVTNRGENQIQVLEAGQAVVTQGDNIVESYDVDLQALYRTSPLLKDLEMDNPEASSQDEAIAQVRAETLEGIRSQRSFEVGEGSDRTQDFRLSTGQDLDDILAKEMAFPLSNGTATVLPTEGTLETTSSRFPGQEIGIEGRFNGNSAAAPPVTTAPPLADSPNVQPPIEVPPLAVEPSIPQPPAIDNPGAATPEPVIPGVMETPSNDTEIPTLPGGGDMPVGIDPDVEPISQGDDLPDGIPDLGGDGAALLPDEPPAADPISPNDGSSTPVIDDGAFDAPVEAPAHEPEVLLPEPVSEDVPESNLPGVTTPEVEPPRADLGISIEIRFDNGVITVGPVHESVQEAISSSNTELIPPEVVAPAVGIIPEVVPEGITAPDVTITEPSEPPLGNGLIDF